jgi:hypothetical protein
VSRPTVSERLASLIESVGFRNVVLRPAKGAWRTDVRQDVYRWEGSAVTHGYAQLPDGLDVSLASWDTMTDCVRHGIILGRGDAGIPTDFLVSVLSSSSLAASRVSP